MEIAQFCQLVKCEVLRTVTRTGHCIIYEVIFTTNQLQDGEMADVMENAADAMGVMENAADAMGVMENAADAMGVMENAGDAMDVMEKAGRSAFRAAKQSEFPMEQLNQQKEQGRGWNDGKHNINSDSTMIT